MAYNNQSQNYPLPQNYPLLQNYPLPPNLTLESQPEVKKFKFPKWLIYLLIGLVIAIILGIIIFSIVKGTSHNNDNTSDNQTSINTESVTVTRRANNSYSQNSINTTRVENRAGSNLSVNDRNSDNRTTINRTDNNPNTDISTNENYVLATNFICDNKRLLGKMSIDEAINQCNNCMGVQKIGDFSFMCGALLTNYTIPDPNLWIQKKYADPNYANEEKQKNIQYIPTGDKLLYNRYSYYKFNYSNLESLSEPLFWTEAINLCNNNDKCIGVEYNGSGNNSIPFKMLDDTPPIVILRFIIPTSPTNKLIYIKNKILSSDSLPTVSNLLTDIITLP